MNALCSYSYVIIIVAICVGRDSSEGTIEYNINTTSALYNVSRYAKVIYNEEAPNDTSSHITVSLEKTPDPSQNTKRLNPLRCRTGPVPEEPYIRPCCDYYYDLFSSRWTDGNYYLTTFLERLQRWNCTQLHTECERQTFSFTKFTELVYQRFCNPNELITSCISYIRDAITRYQFLDSEYSKQSNWTLLVESLNSDMISWPDLLSPCVQIALFDRQDGGVGRYLEIAEPFVPYCGLQWNGFDYRTATEKNVSPWMAMNVGCKAGIGIGMLVMGLGSLFTIICNSIILYVFGTARTLKNSQATYKISLAVADLTIGIVVWPNMIVMQYLTFFTPRSMGSVIIRPYIYEGSNYPYDKPNVTYRYSGRSFTDIFPSDYSQAMGFFSNLGIVVSVYTLMLASIDRLLAIAFPMKYSRHRAEKIAKIVCVMLWLLSCVFAAVPIIADMNLRYTVLSSILIGATGEAALVLLLIGLVVPLIITLVLSVLTFLSSRKHARNRRDIIASQQRNHAYERDLERRLARTLILMVGAYTFSVLAPVCCSVAGLLSTTTTWSDPKNLNLAAANAYTTSEYLSVIILSTNSIWNFFIYNWRNKAFRDYVTLLRKRINSKPGFRHALIAIRRLISMARSAKSYTTVQIRRYSVPFLSTSMSNNVATVSSEVYVATFQQRSSMGSFNVLDKERPVQNSQPE